MFVPKKVVLAYSGGLDTSIILKWLQTEYGCEVVTFTADLGQGEELEPARAKAILMGIRPENIHIVDVREEFVRDFVFPMFRANALYEGLYLLGTSIARPLISAHLVRIAQETGADAVAHGATGKGNDQVRFELSAAALDPAIKVIAPWRLWDLTSRTKLLEFAEANQIPIAKDKRGEAPFSVDANLLHTSSEGRVLENPAEEFPNYVLQRVVPAEEAPDQAEMVEISFEKGDAVAINGERLSPATILTRLNEIGGRHGVGVLHHAALCGTDLQRLLVQPRARGAAGADRQDARACDRHRPRQALQGAGGDGGALVGPFALQRKARHLRRGRRRL
jgi:argininosuccinate synthase